MKKYAVFILVLIFTCIIAVYAQSDDRFINALRDCSPSYRESDNINVNGNNVLSEKSLSGWNNGVCTYKESINFSGKQITTVCRFSKPQVQEIISVADAYALTLKYTNENIDLSSPEAVKNNPLAQVLNKYLQDKEVCSFEGL